MAATLDLGNLLVHMRMDAAQYMSMMKSVEARMRMASQRLAAIGRQLTMRVTLPLVAFGGASVKAFASFDDAMTKSLAIMSGITPQLRKEMGDLALEISSKGVKSATELAKSYFYLASAGFDARQSMASLKAVEEFATAGAFDMTTATDLVTDAQSALGLTVKDAQQNLINMTRVTDTLTGANTLANASSQQYAEALMRAGPAMRSYRIELKEGIAVLGAYADQGKKAAEGGELFGRMLRLMIKGFVDNRQAWNKFKISIVDANDRMRPMADIVRDLTNLLENMGTTQTAVTLNMLGFQARSQQTIMPLLGMADAIEEYNEKLLKMGGITKSVYEKQLKSFSSQMKILWNQIKNTAIGIGRMMAPALLRLNEKIRKAIAYWNLMEDSVKRSIFVYAGVAAAIGPVLLATGLLLKSFTFMIATVNVLMASFVGLSAAMFSWLGVALLLAAVAYTLRTAWNQNLEVIKNRMQEWFDAFKTGFDWLANTVLGKFIIWMGDTFIDAFEVIGEGWKDFIANIAAGAASAWAFLRNIRHGFKAATEAWAMSYTDTFTTIQGKMNNFERVTASTFKTSILYLKAFGDATVEHLQELLDAVKTQFGQDADALITLIESKILKLKVSGAPLVLAPADVAALEKELKKLTDQFDRFNEEVEDASPFEQWMGNAKDVTNRVSEFFARTFNRMGDVLATFLIDGKADFKSFAKAVLKDLLAIIIRAQMVRALTTFFPGLIPAPAPTPQPVYMVSSPVRHRGGLVGAGDMPQRMVPAATFIGAPRLHGGLAPDEFPSILQRGETVIPKGGGAAPTVVINNNTGQRFEQEGAPKWNGREWVVGIITEEIHQYGPLRQTIQGIGQSA